MRKVAMSSIYELAKRDPRVVFVGSDLGGRGELYERFYLSDSFKMTALAYAIADKSLPESLVEQFLHD